MRGPAHAKRNRKEKEMSVTIKIISTSKTKNSNVAEVVVTFPDGSTKIGKVYSQQTLLEGKEYEGVVDIDLVRNKVFLRLV